MTAKEAKKIIIKERDSLKANPIVKVEDCLYEAFEVAIKALEQQPCEDAISRTDVKKYLSAPDANGDRVIYESDLDLLPPVTPQPKTGHWINLDETHSKCDRCGAVFEIASENGEANYCPSCGAKMEVEE